MALLVPVGVLVVVLANCGGGARTPNVTVPARGGPAADTLAEVPFARDPDTPPPECETMQYPCSWGEVDTATVDRAFRALGDAQRMLGERRSIADIASWIRAQPGIGRVSTGSGLIRFNFKGAPPLLLMSDDRFRGPQATARPDAHDPTRRPPSGPSGEPELHADASRGMADLRARRSHRTPAYRGGYGRVQATNDPIVGDNSDATKRPHKRALVLGLYDWEFGTEETEQTRRILEASRSYGCEGCVDVRVSDYTSSCKQGTTPESQCPVAIATNWRDFTGWERFDLIHVGTHGGHECTDDGWCATSLLTGNHFVWLEGDPMDSYRLAVPGGTVRAFRPTFPPGVTYVAVGPDRSCAEIRAGTPRWESLCAPGRVAEAVTDDFFLYRYPRGLQDKVVMFSACHVFNSSFFVPHLVRGGNTTIVGWMDPVPNETAILGSVEFYRRLIGAPDKDFRVGGQRAREAWAGAVGTVWPIGSYFRVAAGADSVISRERASISDTDTKRGREMPFLIDRRSDTELEDGQMLLLRGLTNDGRPDSLDLQVDVTGIGDDEDAAGYRIRFRLDGEDLPGSYPLTERVGEALHRFRGVVPLGRDAKPEQRVDLDVRVVTGDGGTSRWLYRDLLLLGVCTFSGSIIDVRIPEPRERLLAAVGRYEGRAQFDDDGSLELTIRNQPGSPRNHGTSVVNEFTLTAVPASPLRGPTAGQTPLAGGRLNLSRPNPLHNPARPNRSTAQLFTSLDYDPRQDDRAGAAHQAPGFIDVQLRDAGAMLGRLEMPLALRNAALRFEGVFWAGPDASCNRLSR